MVCFWLADSSVVLHVQARLLLHSHRFWGEHLCMKNSNILVLGSDTHWQFDPCWFALMFVFKAAVESASVSYDTVCSHREQWVAPMALLRQANVGQYVCMWVVCVCTLLVSPGVPIVNVCCHVETSAWHPIPRLLHGTERASLHNNLGYHWLCDAHHWLCSSQSV